jgi:opacity protein-like surface antigen
VIFATKAVALNTAPLARLQIERHNGAGHAEDLMRKPVITAIAALVLLCGATVSRADPYNWTGYYAGLSIGGSWDSGNLSQLTSGVSQPPYLFIDTTGALTGVPGTIVGVPGTIPLPGSITSRSSNNGSIIGVDWQIGSVIFGVQGDIQGLDSSQNFAFAGPQSVFSPVTSNFTGTIKLRRNVEGTTRLRFGYAWDRWLAYGTGGIAFSSLDVTSTYNYNFALPAGATPLPGVSEPANAMTSSSTGRFLMGPSIGGGLEYAICDNVSVGVDYRHNFFGTKRLNLGTTPTLTSLGSARVPPVVTMGSPVSARYNLDEDAVMLRVSWRFQR